MRRHNAEHPARLGEHEALAFSIPEWHRRIPVQCRSTIQWLRAYASAASGVLPWAMQPGSSGTAAIDEDLVLVTPVDDDLVFVLVYSFFPSSPERAMMWRT